MSPWPIRRFSEVGSTQDLAVAAAQTGEPGPFIFLADRQTAGRGRGGRAWTAPAGNLNFSALLRPGPIPMQAATWSLLAGVAIHDAIATYLPVPHGLMLKWPNDLLLHGAKLAGVLIDSALTPAGLTDWIVIGIGANLAAAPSLPDRPTACLADAGIMLAPEMLAETLAVQLETWLQAGPAATRQAWLQRAHKIGTALRIHQGDQVLQGTFAGLAEDGRALLDLGPAHTMASIASGDVFLAGV